MRSASHQLSEHYHTSKADSVCASQSVAMVLAHKCAFRACASCRKSPLLVYIGWYSVKHSSDVKIARRCRAQAGIATMWSPLLIRAAERVSEPNEESEARRGWMSAYSVANTLGAAVNVIKLLLCSEVHACVVLWKHSPNLFKLIRPTVCGAHHQSIKMTSWLTCDGCVNDARA